MSGCAAPSCSFLPSRQQQVSARKGGAPRPTNVLSLDFCLSSRACISMLRSVHPEAGGRCSMSDVSGRRVRPLCPSGMRGGGKLCLRSQLPVFGGHLFRIFKSKRSPARSPRTRKGDGAVRVFLLFDLVCWFIQSSSHCFCLLSPLLGCCRKASLAS